MHSGSLYPFSSHRNILEYESFDAACPVESECLYIHSADNGFVEVPYQCGHQQIDRIFSQEGFGQTLPSESVQLSNPDVGLVKNLGKVLFNEFLLPFELSSVLLLTAMVGAVLLAKNDKQHG